MRDYEKQKIKKYYLERLSKTKSPASKKYYLKELEDLDTPKKQKKTKRRQKWMRIYVGSLDKEFRSARKASEALGKSKHYVYLVLANKKPNDHNVKVLDN